HARTFHHVKRATYRAQFEYIRLREIDRTQPMLRRLTPGIAKTGKTEVHRQGARLYALSDFECQLAGAATGTENINGTRPAFMPKIGQRESFAQISGYRDGMV